MLDPWAKVRRRLRHRRAEHELSAQLARVEAYLAQAPAAGDEAPPIMIFNASTRIHRLSLNAAFALLTSWGLRANGEPVKYVVCQHGMAQCVLGALWDRPLSAPPCRPCLAYSRKLFPSDAAIPFELDGGASAEAEDRLAGASLDGLSAWESGGLALGNLCLPSVRWVLRRHHLQDNETTRRLYRRFLASAVSLAERFEALMDENAPRALVLFNGLTYPEAVARVIAERRGVPVVTHEVGLRPYSAFFSHEEATFRQVPLDDGRRLSPDENAQLDAYLEKRQRGRFSMAGIEFWPDIQGLPGPIAERAGEGRPLVTIFTNVVFDTSQVHANTLFEDMFDWLGALAGVIRSHPGTTFVIRAHPDEDRPGKASQESVADWMQASDLLQLPNVFFLAPSDYASSYELVGASRLVLVYSSSIGLEASIQGTPVLCAGRARYTQHATVMLPASRGDYLQVLDRLLSTQEIAWPDSFVDTARAFLHTELFQASLDFSDFLRPYPEAPGMVLLRDFQPELLADHPSLNVIRHGILSGAPFLLQQRTSARGFWR